MNTLNALRPEFYSFMCGVLFTVWMITAPSCAHIPLSTFNGPGGYLVTTDASGFVVNAQGYQHMLSEGATPAMFTVVPQGYHMTNAAYHDFNEIRVPARNPVLK